MAKIASIKRGKPSYFMSILGVTLVLFFLGIIGWLVINANKLGDYFKEKVEVRAFIRGNPTTNDSAALMNYISSKAYVRAIEYINREKAKEIYINEGGDDWGRVLTENPLPNAIYFKVKKQYLNTDSLEKIKADLREQTWVDTVEYPAALISKMSENMRRISLAILIIAIVLSLVVIILIDNTIRLAMFSNRFLIKTMQMVGATRGFIAKPMNIRAIINGAIGGIIAAIAVYILILVMESQIKDLKTIRDNSMLFLLFFVLIIIGICITLFSTHRSVIKYLKMKLDDLY